MKKHALKQRLNQAVPDISPVFATALEQALDGLAAKDRAEPDAAAAKRPRLSGGFARRALVIAVAAALLIGAAALATSLLRQNVFEVILGDSPHNAVSVMQYDLARESFGECDVEVRQAAYDGVSLYVVYSVRERAAAEPLGIIDTRAALYRVESDTFPAMERDGIGWWRDCLWINGEWVRLPDMSSIMVLGSDTPGELLFYNLYRLDLAGVYPDGKAVEISLPIGKRQPPEALDYNEETSEVKLPDAGVISFALDCSVRGGVTETHPGITAELPFGTAEVLDAVYTPIQLYVTLQYTVAPEALAAFREKYGEGYEDENGHLMVDENGNVLMPIMENDVVADWVSSLMLVDADGKLVYDAYSPLLRYGLLGYWNAQARFAFPCLDTYPDEMYLAPMTGSDADTALAVRVK